MALESQDRKRRTANRLRLGGLALVLAASILVAASAPLHQLTDQAVTALGGFIDRHPAWGVLAFIGLAAVSAMLAFFSTVMIVPVAVHHWGSAVSVLLLWIGWLLGGIAAYIIGRYLGRPAVHRLVGSTTARYYEEQITSRAPFPVILLFQAALPSEIPGYVLGMARYPFLTYLLALSLAELPFAVGVVLLGSGFLNRQYWLMVGVGVAGIVVVGVAVRALHRRLSNARTTSFATAASPSADPPAGS